MTADEIDRIVRAMAPVFRDYVTKAVHGLELRVTAAEVMAASLPLAEAAVTGLEKAFGDLRERVATVEARKPDPGPPGPPGADGAAGKDGTAGLRYTGVYDGVKTYEPGDVTTWAGSTWHCNEITTTKPGDNTHAWTLMVKRGRDGKDGKP